MPFRSEAERRYMHANHPEIAARWEAETPETKLPERVGSTRGSKTSKDGVNPDLAAALKSIEH